MTDTQPALINALLQGKGFDHPVEAVRLIETHISWVLLTGQFAYKIKKPVDFGFLDFSTLEKRHFCCEEELRLNRRLAPNIYLAVLAIHGSAENPCFEGEGEAIEYAVKMQQFPQQAQLDRMLLAGKLTPAEIDAIADMIAGFHQVVAVADPASHFGDSEHVFQPVVENFSQIRDRLPDEQCNKTIQTIEEWSLAAFTQLTAVFTQRKQQGFIRECHGDMHLRNLAWIHDAPIAFDCIEFNPDLRWIDVISEIAFLVMDLQERGQSAFANRFLNDYLEHTGDYAGLAVLKFYLVYRAMVRAKVDIIRATQQGIDTAEQKAAMQDFNAYLQLAQQYIHPQRPVLIITRGMSGSGKSTLTRPLLEQLGAIRIRSDVERKRLFQVQPQHNAGSGIETGIYSATATSQTYQQLASLAAGILAAGQNVIVDATFARAEQRQLFAELAGQKKVAYIILEFTAAADTLRQRIRARTQDVSDANLEVLEHQLSVWQPLDPDEQAACVQIDTEAAFDVEHIIATIGQIQTLYTPL